MDFCCSLASPIVIASISKASIGTAPFPLTNAHCSYGIIRPVMRAYIALQVMMAVRNLYITFRHVMGLYWCGSSLHPSFGIKIVRPITSHLLITFGCPMALHNCLGSHLALVLIVLPQTQLSNFGNFVFSPSARLFFNFLMYQFSLSYSLSTPITPSKTV